MTKRKVYCFIAIRFGQPDTDAIYEKIAATASKLGLDPRRVDRLQHIENINEKIIGELNDSDLAVADLTYERPSVYFEAGYAQRKVPLIYTCRADHLDKKSNYRVHFDVDRYPIIPWKDPDDLTFPSALETRLRYVVNNLANIPLVDDLRTLQSDLIISHLNPQNVFKRIDSLKAQLDEYPRVGHEHPNHERNIEARICLKKSIFEMIKTDFAKETEIAQQNQWEDFYYVLEHEASYLERLFEDSNLSKKVLYATFLNELYPVYLECMAYFHRDMARKEYHEVYDRVMSGIDKLIQDLDRPFY